MRPPEFTGGNVPTDRLTGTHRTSFNEAAGIHRRKRGLDELDLEKITSMLQ